MSRGKNAARRLRREGMIPAVVYGGKGDTMAVAVDPKALQKVLRSEAGRNTILKLDIAGQGRDKCHSEELAGRSHPRALPACGFLPHRDGRGDSRDCSDRNRRAKRAA